MVNIILYIATSLDGYIARKDGSIDWLSMVETNDTDYGYADFYRSVDALVMGRRTYEQALGFGEWPYPGKPSYVFTRQRLTSKRNDVFFTSAKPDTVIREMETQGFKRIWLVGGAELTAAFLKFRLVDEYIISIIPIILGEGIPMFLPPIPEERLKLIQSQQYPTGLVQLRYRRK
ncbi:MAG: dihydrofolate reductase family protein [Nitrososphaera sp.]|nr:dihydrofolate reductase family protein [Nitrososphaera sp.]